MIKRNFIRSCRGALIIIIFVLSNRFSFSNGQDRNTLKYGSEPDSLIMILPGLKNDSIKVTILNEISDKIKYLNGPEAVRYANEGLELSKEINYLFGTALSHYHLGTAFWAQGDYDKAFASLHPALEFFRNGGYKKMEAESLNRIGLIYFYQSNYDRSIEYLALSIEQFTALKDTVNLARVTNNLGLVYDKMGEYEISFDYLMRAMELNESMGHLKDQSKSAVFNISPIQRNKYFNDQTMKHYQSKLEELLKTEREDEIADVYRTIGDLHMYQNRIDQAIEVYQKANQILAVSKRELVLAGCLEDLGLCYQQKGDYEISTDYFLRSLEYFKEAGLNLRVSSVLEHLALSYENLGNFQLAKHYLIRDLELNEELGNQFTVANDHLKLGGVLFQNLEYDLAIGEAQEALTLSENIKAKHLQKESYKLLSEIHSAVNNFPVALNNYVKYSDLNLEMFNERSAKHVAYLQVKYETEKKAREIASLSQENLRKEELISRRTQIIILVSIISILAIATLILIMNRFYIIRKSNQEKSSLLGEIHHRVKNNLQIISSLLSLQSRLLSDEDAAKAITDSQSRVKSMGLIHNYLYKEKVFSRIDLKKYIRELSKSIIETYKGKNQEVKLQLNVDAIKPDIDTMVPLALIINELITNCLKHAFNNVKYPILSISLNEIDKQLILCVKDNGNLKADLGNRDINTFGWNLVRSLTVKLGGILDTNYDNGLRVTASFTKYNAIVE